MVLNSSLKQSAKGVLTAGMYVGLIKLLLIVILSAGLMKSTFYSFEKLYKMAKSY
jgi:hypothetical protein